MLETKKKIFTCILVLLNFSVFSQWTAINSGTLNRLNDVDLINDLYGIVVGDSGYVNLTTNGGSVWTAVSPSDKYSYTSVILKSADTIWISGQDAVNNKTAVFASYNTGVSWDTIYTYGVAENSNLYYHNGYLYIAGNWLGLFKTGNLGVQWQQIYSGGGTSLYDKAEFFDNSGIYYGNHAGFATYSWGFNKTGDLSGIWYSNGPYGQVTEAVSEMFALNSNEIYMFSNIFQQWLPSNTSRFVKLSAFYLENASVLDSQWVFTYQLINGQINEYVNDCYFENNLLGYAVGAHGKIIKTTDGGVTWTTEYTSVADLNAIKIISHTSGYAVGAFGKIIKLSDLSVAENTGLQKSGFQIFPNPASGNIHVQSDKRVQKISILSVTGKLLKIIDITDKNERNWIVNLHEFSTGIYLMKVETENGLIVKKFTKE